MRKLGFLTAIAATIATASVALTGCAGSQDSAFNSSTDDTVDNRQSDWQVHFNRDTGAITAIFDHEDEEREMIFSSPSFDEKEDFALPFDYYSLGDYADSLELVGSLTVNGVGQAAKSAEISWSLGSMNWASQTDYYNEHVASPEALEALIGNTSTSADTPASFDITTAILVAIRDEVRAGSVPIPKFSSNGKATIYKGADYLVEGYANGVDPRDLVLQLTGSEPDPDPDTAYTYTFMCATYDVVLENKSEIQNWIDAFPMNADGVQFNIYSGQGTATVSTDQPCDISIENPINLPSKEDTSDQPAQEEDY